MRPMSTITKEEIRGCVIEDEKICKRCFADQGINVDILRVGLDVLIIDEEIERNDNTIHYCDYCKRPL